MTYNVLYEKYKKDLSYSYVFGAFGTIELLNNKINEVLCVIIDPSFTNQKAYEMILNLCNENNIKVIVDLPLISKIRDKGNIFVIGVFKKYNDYITNTKHLILYKENDYGCIGTIIRSMQGFDYNNLILIDCDIDIFNEHLIRSTMGAFFKTNIIKMANIEEYMLKFPNHDLLNISLSYNFTNKLDKVDENTTLIFSNNAINNDKIKHYSFNKNIAMDQIVNLTLFNIY